MDILYHIVLNEQLEKFMKSKTIIMQSNLSHYYKENWNSLNDIRTSRSVTYSSFVKILKPFLTIILASP